MRLKLVIVACAILAVALFIFLLFKKNAGSNPRVCVKNTCFNVTVAGTPAERERGLMFVTELKPDAGMLFIFEQNGIYPFWMKNTLIPLDIIWLDEDKRVVYISANTPPCLPAEALAQAGANYNCPVFSPETEARYVLEVNAGAAERLQLQTGDTVIYPVE